MFFTFDNAMDSNDNDDTDLYLNEIIKRALSDKDASQKWGNLESYDATVNTDAIFTELMQGMPNMNPENQTTFEIDEENKMYDDNDLSQIFDNAGEYLFNLQSAENMKIEENSDQFPNLVEDPTTSNEQSQPVIQHSIAKTSCAVELIQSDRFDDAWKKLREKEKLLIRRNVPRLMMFYNYHSNCYINCILHILLNAPVFIRQILILYNVQQSCDANLQLSQIFTDIQVERDFFKALVDIVKAALEEYHNDDVDNIHLQTLRDKYKALHSRMKDGIQQDADEFLIHLMNVLKAVACELDQMKSFSKAFEIVSLVSVDGNESQCEKDPAIRVLPDERDFPQYINEHYTGTVVEHVDGHIITRIYEPLPEHLVATADRQQNGSAVYYPFPTEFTTRSNQCYLFTGAVIHDGISLNSGHYIALFRRQDSVYIIDGLRVDRFHINDLPAYFEKVHGRAVIYTRIDPLCRYIYTFEDPLHGTYARAPCCKTTDYFKTQQLQTPIQLGTFSTSTVAPLVIILHPILSTSRYYMHSDFIRNNINTEIPTLKDCLDQDPLYFSPRSAFAGSVVECTLVFKGPDEEFYRSHYEFVRTDGPKIRFENPTYFDITKDNASNSEWFSLKLTISKPRQDVLQRKDERKNETDGNNQQNETCELVHFPSVLRRAHWLPDEQRYLTDPEILFRSNSFKLVSSTTKKSTYNYDSDLLKITQLYFLESIPFHKTDKSTIVISYLISEMYKYTAFRDKYLHVTILTGSEEEPRVHPIYQILDEQSRVSTMKYPVNEYSSPLTITIVKRTMNEFRKNSRLRQTLNDPSMTRSAVPIVIKDSLQTILTSPSMSSFRIQLQLCHSSNDETIVYPRSKVISNIVIDESGYQEQQVLPQSPEIDNAECNDHLSNQLPVHVKRSFDEEISPSMNTPSNKCQKRRDDN